MGSGGRNVIHCHDPPQLLEGRTAFAILSLLIPSSPPARWTVFRRSSDPHQDLPSDSPSTVPGCQR